MKAIKENFVLIIIILISLTYCTTSDKNENTLSYLSELDLDVFANTLSQKEKENGWRLLFDGVTTEGWRGYNMNNCPNCWTVKNDCLTVISEGEEEDYQSLVTDKVYKNFVLSVEVKLTTAANSGIIYQVAEGPKYKYAYETGHEFSIIDHENWPTPLDDLQINGSNYAMYPPRVKPYKKIGEWNHYLLVVDGNKVTQILNGEIVVEYEKYSDEWIRRRDNSKWTYYPDWGKFDTGHICLQNHGSKLWYRNIKLKELNI